MEMGEKKGKYRFFDVGNVCLSNRTTKIVSFELFSFASSAFLILITLQTDLLTKKNMANKRRESTSSRVKIFRF